MMGQENFVWHPNTQMKEWLKFDKIVTGKGVWLIDSNGNKLLDGVASMWCGAMYGDIQKKNS